jgi:eukaryotic-like serine/threonine-protein kinase
MANPTAALSKGDLVGNYRILGMLGAGGMGVVYRAFDTKLERTVALKFLPDHLLHDIDEKKRVLREARTASSLDHPNIGVIHGFEETSGGRVFIVMAYYEGESIAEKLHHGPLPIADALDFAIQTAQGLSAAHSGAVIHRDIKPGNIVVTKSGMAKIVDFGLARITQSSGSTQSIASGGTVGYMSPEQALSRMVDQRTDIWALGITLAEMLTGKGPFQRDSAAATVIAILNDAPQGLDDLPPDLRRIIYHALAKQPEARYQSCNEMLADLQDFQAELVKAGGVPAKPTRPTAAETKELRLKLENASRSTLHVQGTSSSTRKPWGFGLLALAVLAALLLLIPSVRNLVTRGTPHAEDHIAVLPFDNLGGDPAMEAESQGLMDAMTDQLSNLSSVQKSLWVIPSSVVRSRKIADPSAAARELGATLVVRGSVQRIGQSIRLNIQLIDAKNLRQIGGASLEDNSGDVAALQSDAVSRLAQLLGVKASADMLRATGGNVAPAAYESYLKARGFMQRYDKPGNLDQAISALSMAIEKDPRFALGYSQLGEAYRLKYVVDKNTKWLDEALTNTQKAAQIDSTLPSAYVTLARIHNATGKTDLALTEFQQALKLNPKSAEALSGLAKSYEASGRTKEAEEAFAKAAALRPDYWDGYNELGLFFDRQSKYPQALEQLKRAAELTPDNAQVYSNLGAVYIDTGDPKSLPDAEQALKKSIALSPSYPAYANLASLYVRQKRYAESTGMWEAALKLNDQDYLVWSYLVNTYEWLKQDSKAAESRERMLALLEPLVKLHPQDQDAQATLATVYAKKNLRDKAIIRIQAALALAPDNPGVLENAAVVYDAIGDRSKAIQYAQQVIEKGGTLDDLRSDPDLQNVLADPNFRTKAK